MSAVNGFDIELEFNMKLAEQLRNREEAIKRPNILLCGYTGSGKSSLIKAICGDVVPDKAIGAGVPKTMGYDEYHNELVKFFDSRGFENGDSEEEFISRTREFIRSRQDKLNVDEHIHMFWYAIQAPGARVTDCDLRLINEIFPKDHVVVALTKCDSARDNQIDTLAKLIAESGFPKSRIVSTSDIEGGRVGCQRLMELTEQMLPAAYRNAFIEAQVIDIGRRVAAIKGKNVAAKSIIASGTTAAAAAAGINPIPVSDAILIIPIQLGMIAGLAALYGVGEKSQKATLIPFLAKLAGTYTVASLSKLIPIAGGIINAGVAGSITGGLGWYLQSRFETMAIAAVKGEPIPDLPFDNEAIGQIIAMKSGENKNIPA